MAEHAGVCLTATDIVAVKAFVERDRFRVGLNQGVWPCCEPAAPSFASLRTHP